MRVLTARTTLPTPRLPCGCGALIVGILLLFTAVAWAEVCKGSKVPKSELRHYDAEATLLPQETEAALATHLPWGQPACPKLLPNREYILCYASAQRAALWAAYELRGADVVTRARRDAFRSDPRLSMDENAHCADYAGTGFARGHMVPDADMGRSESAQANTYFFSNMTPQWPQLNSGPWLWLERTVRDYATQYGQVYVLSGSIFNDPPVTVPSGRVRVPARYFKVLLRTGPNTQPLALAMILPNQRERFAIPERTSEERERGVRASDRLLRAHLVSVREIERLTGLELLPQLDQEALKRAVASELWPRN